MVHRTLLFSLRLLGTPSLKDADGTTPPSLGWGKPLALLAFLAVRGEARRDEIVDLLWRDVHEAKARNAFRQALHRLRSALGDTLIPLDREVLRLSRSDDLTVDLHDFESAAANARIEQAIELYRGDFLHGVALDEPPFDLWADQERNRLRGQFRGLLEHAVGGAQAEGRWTEAIAISRRLIEIAPLDESAARINATSLLSAGRRAEARDALLQFGSRLNAELGLPLPAEAQSMLARLDRMGDGGRPAPGVSIPAPPALAFAGREGELSRLLSLWRATGEDSGTLALVEGDAGIGKTRLLQEHIAHARSLRRSAVLHARERPAAAQVPFALFADAFRPLVRAAGIVGASRHLLAEASRLLPELRDSLDLPPLASIEDEAARVRFFEGVAALVDAAAYEQPLLVVLDDLQHIGPSSLDLLSYLSARLAGSAVMFVLAFRPSDAPSAVAGRLRALADAGGTDRARGDRAMRLVLRPIDRTAAALAIDADGLAQRLGGRVIDQILLRADGMPGRLPELLRRAAAGDDIAQLPVSVRALVQERLQRLSSSQRRAFLVLGLLGRAVSLKTLADASHLSEGAARETVQVLAAEGLVEADDLVVRADPSPAEVALEVAGQASRAFLAGWIVDALAADPRTPPAELARFYSMAGRASDAFAASRQAAFAAMRVGAWPEAVQHLQSARTFAADTGSIADVEGLLAAFGAGSLRIPSGAGAAPAPDVTSSGPAAHAAHVPSAWERWFPNWRVLLGAAVATLVISALVMWRTPARAARAPSRDTLVVVEGESGRVARHVTGDLVTGFSLSEAFDRPGGGPAWADSLARPWTSALVGPRGQLVAVMKVGPSGSDVYVISANRRDTVQVTRDEGDARALGWSPDGRWILVATTSRGGDGAMDADLLAVRADGSRRVSLDTAGNRSVVEALWSPDGSRIAWVARVGLERQQEVFLSLPDGSGMENVSRHPADDHHINWSGDGELLGFTSVRDGNAELYAVSVREGRLWRLTRDPAQDDWAQFSASGRLVAFESTRGGSAGVYVMAALGGVPRRIASPNTLSPQGWRGRWRYADRLRVETFPVGETIDDVGIRVTVLDQFGAPMPARSAVTVRAVDSAYAQVAPVDSANGIFRLIGERAGLSRLIVDLSRWRSDTIMVRTGSAPLAILEGRPDFTGWRALGQPRPFVTPGGIALNSDRDWESGILSRPSVPLSPGVRVGATIVGHPRIVGATVTLALVAAEQSSPLDTVAPQFFRYASFTWDADARRLVYSVGREVFTEQSEDTSSRLDVTLSVQSDSTVIFLVDGRQRWKSGLRVIQPGGQGAAQLWIGGRGTGSTSVVTEGYLRLEKLSRP